ncbi:ATP-binding cassette domain-containing protein [Actinomadura keratinilytica]
MLLDVRDLQVEFHTREGVAKAVNGVSYSVDAGETLAVLGESGSGKSVTAQAVMGILDTPPGHITGGQIIFEGRDLLTLKEDRRRKVRGAEMAMIFQDALSSSTRCSPSASSSARCSPSTAACPARTPRRGRSS